MFIIPAINCPDFECVTDKLKKSAEFLPAGGWVQLDIADGKFAEHTTWNHPEELQELRIRNYELSKIDLEVHLMVEESEKVIDGWIGAGAKRTIIHLESLSPAGSINRTKVFKKILDKCRNSNVELGLAISPGTPAENPSPYWEFIRFIQLLAVPPGESGQVFDQNVLPKIKFLKKNHPDVIIEVDGGINLRTAKLCKGAGADILVAGSYIWGSDNPQKSYEELKGI